MAAGDRIRRHEADIVPVVGVFRARIAETCKQQHRSLRRSEAHYFSSAAAAGFGRRRLRPSLAVSGFIAEEPAMVAMVKSRSAITGARRPAA